MKRWKVTLRGRVIVVVADRYQQVDDYIHFYKDRVVISTARLAGSDSVELMEERT